jgi:hypothetical protein
MLADNQRTWLICRSIYITSNLAIDAQAAREGHIPLDRRACPDKTIDPAVGLAGFSEHADLLRNKKYY